VLAHLAVLWSCVIPLAWEPFIDPGFQKASQKSTAIGDTLVENIPLAEKGCIKASLN